jgi:Fe-S cluster assembly ATPase SufC
MPAVQETIERVRHIDVDQYKKGTVHAIIGPNGLGKSTLAMCSPARRTTR